MKKLSMILSICLAAGMFFTRASAQQSYSEWFTSSYWAPVVCDGVLVDIISGGVISVHQVTHTNWAKSGIYQNVQIKGTAVSESTGEVFTVKETGRMFFNGEMWVYLGKINLRGDQGTHYIGEFTFNSNFSALLDINIKCK